MTKGVKIQFRNKGKYYQSIVENYLNDWLEKQVKTQRRTMSDLIKFILADYYFRHEADGRYFKGIKDFEAKA